MDIAALSIVTVQSKVQQVAGITVMNTAIDTGKENANQMIEKAQKIAVDNNLGQNLDVISDKQNDKKDELHKLEQQEMKWAQEKQKMLNIKETKLLQMREIAEQGKQLTSLSPQEVRKLNHRLDKLAAQVSAIDSNSRRTKDGKKLE